MSKDNVDPNWRKFTTNKFDPKRRKVPNDDADSKGRKVYKIKIRCAKTLKSEVSFFNIEI